MCPGPTAWTPRPSGDAGVNMARTTELRDAALGLVRTKGTWVPVPVDGKELRFLMAEANGVRVLYRTLFQRVPEFLNPALMLTRSRSRGLGLPAACAGRLGPE